MFRYFLALSSWLASTTTIAPLLAFILLCVASTAQAENTGDRWAYARDAVDAFSTIAQGTSTKSSIAASSITNLEILNSYLSENMNNAIQSKRSFDKARAILSKYDKSADPNIRQSFTMLNAAIFIMGVHYDNRVGLFERQLNKTPEEATSSLGTLSREARQSGQETQEGWSLYTQAATTVTYALIDGNFDLEHLNTADLHKKLTSLSIAAWQRDDLKNYIIQRFGRQINSKPDNAVTITEIPARVMLKFLDDSWKIK